MTFAERLRYLREQKGISQAEVARRLDINHITYGLYEQGRRHPNYEMLIQFADFYDVSIDYLLGRIPSEVIDIKEALENPTKTVTWNGQELSDNQRKKLLAIFCMIWELFNDTRGNELTTAGVDPGENTKK